jgi:hypothetical protein
MLTCTCARQFHSHGTANLLRDPTVSERAGPRDKSYDLYSESFYSNLISSTGHTD